MEKKKISKPQIALIVIFVLLLFKNHNLAFFLLSISLIYYSVKKKELIQDKFGMKKDKWHGNPLIYAIIIFFMINISPIGLFGSNNSSDNNTNKADKEVSTSSNTEEDKKQLEEKKKKAEEERQKRIEENKRREEENKKKQEEARKREEEQKKKEQDKIPSGQYKIGDKMPAGEYKVFAEGGHGYIAASTNTSGDIESILFNDNFTTFTYVKLESGNYFEMKSCYAVPVDKAEKFNGGTSLTPGMYKVGVDIPAGDYNLMAEGGHGYMAIYNVPHGEIITNDNFENNKLITIQDGQYLMLTRATGEKQ